MAEIAPPREPGARRESETPRWRRLVSEFAVELVALVAVAVVVAVLRGNGLRMDLRAFEFTLPPMLHSLPKILATGLAIHVGLALFRRDRGGRSGRGGAVLDYLRSFVKVPSIALWLRLCAAFMLSTFAYAWLKVCVPLLNHRLWDPELWSLERWLHFGVSPNIFVLELVGRSPVLPALDLWYAFWISTVFVAWAWAAAHPDPDTRKRFLFGCALLSLVGSWLYATMPALGPCYASPDLFAGFADEMPRALAAQKALAANYAKMLAGRDGSLDRFNPYLGIAAMPSLHVAAHWYFALWARRYRRAAFWPLAGMTLVTFLGSLATGWHYAVDGYAGIVLAWIVFEIARRVVPEKEPSGEKVPEEPGAKSIAAEGS